MSKPLTASPAGKQVLVVDDDRAVLGLVEHWLAAAGFSVVTRDRFETAKEYLSANTPDVLLTDVRLGAFNGLQLVILAKELGPQTTTVVMSAYDDPALRKEAQACGAAYITKPFTLEQVLAAVTNTAAPDR